MNNNYTKKWLFDTKSMIVRRNVKDALKSISRMELKLLVSQQGWHLTEMNGQFIVYK